MYKNQQGLGTDAYNEAPQCTSPEQQPELAYILERMGYELSEIHSIKYDLIRKGHQIKDTNAPDKGDNEVSPPANDLVSILNNHLSSLSSIKESLHQFNKKLNSLI